MALDKYNFIAGDKLPAENVNSIDPDNINPQTAGYLTGGTGHSALSVFKDLANGTNDGKFKINVDGTEYDNVAISFQYFADTFLAPRKAKLILIKIQLSKFLI